MTSHICALFVDGGVIGRNPSEIGGSVAWVHYDYASQPICGYRGLVLNTAHPDYRVAGRFDRTLHDGPVTNNLTEFIAMVLGLESLPDGWWGHIYTDSQVTLLRTFKGGALNNIPDVWRGRMMRAKHRLDLDRVQPVLLDGHPTKAQLEAGIGKRGNPVHQGNVWCDRACNEVMDSYRKWLEGE